MSTKTKSSYATGILLIIGAALVSLFFSLPTQAHTSSYIHIMTDLDNEDSSVDAWYFCDGEVTLTVENPPGNFIFTAIKDTPIMEEYCTYTFGPEDGLPFLWADTIVTVSDTSSQKETIILGIHLPTIDYRAETVTGWFGNPDASLALNTCVLEECTTRHLSLDPFGNYFEDFSIPGDEPDEPIFDLKPGTLWSLRATDDDEDEVEYRFSDFGLYIQGYLHNDRVVGRGFQPGYPVTLAVYATPADIEPLLTRTKTAVEDLSHPGGSIVDIRLKGEFNLLPGMKLTLSDEEMQIEVLLADIGINTVDTETDTVSGYGPALWTIYVEALCEDPDWCPNRSVESDENGNWSADFSQPGDTPDEQDLADLTAESSFLLILREEDNDSTRLVWEPDEVPAEITDFLVQPWVLQTGQSVTASALLQDQESNDTYRVTWDWGDGSATEMLITGTETGITPVMAEHTYHEPNLYTVTLDVKEEGVAQVEDIYGYIKVYDPDAGFTNGIGIINSPAGAYLADQSLEGRAYFNFSSIYPRRQNTPVGNVQFLFPAARLVFRSIYQDWLVITGEKFARIRGTGLLNGRLAPNGNEYIMVVWAVDGAQLGEDTFGILIVYMDGENQVTVYDSGMFQQVITGFVRVHSTRR